MAEEREVGHGSGTEVAGGIDDEGDKVASGDESGAHDLGDAVALGVLLGYGGPFGEEVGADGVGLDVGLGRLVDHGDVDVGGGGAISHRQVCSAFLVGGGFSEDRFADDHSQGAELLDEGGQEVADLVVAEVDEELVRVAVSVVHGVGLEGEVLAADAVDLRLGILVDGREAEDVAYLRRVVGIWEEGLIPRLEAEPEGRVDGSLGAEHVGC